MFDIFGFFPQTQQGADILAATVDATVYMPDFFESGAPFPVDQFPPETDEVRPCSLSREPQTYIRTQAKNKLQAFFGGIASPPKNTEKLIEFGKVLRSQGASFIGAYGFCWGGKVTISSAAAGSPFDATAIVHPAMLSVEDAEKVTGPFAIYISKDEPVDEVIQLVHRGFCMY